MILIDFDKIIIAVGSLIFGLLLLNLDLPSSDNAFIIVGLVLVLAWASSYFWTTTAVGYQGHDHVLVYTRGEILNLPALEVHGSRKQQLMQMVHEYLFDDSYVSETLVLGFVVLDMINESENPIQGDIVTLEQQGNIAKSPSISILIDRLQAITSTILNESNCRLQIIKRQKQGSKYFPRFIAIVYGLNEPADVIVRLQLPKDGVKIRWVSFYQNGRPKFSRYELEKTFAFHQKGLNIDLPALLKLLKAKDGFITDDLEFEIPISQFSLLQQYLSTNGHEISDYQQGESFLGLCNNQAISIDRPDNAVILGNPGKLLPFLNFCDKQLLLVNSSDTWSELLFYQKGGIQEIAFESVFLDLLDSAFIQMSALHAILQCIERHFGGNGHLSTTIAKFICSQQVIGQKVTCRDLMQPQSYSLYSDDLSNQLKGTFSDLFDWDFLNPATDRTSIQQLWMMEAQHIIIRILEDVSFVRLESLVIMLFILKNHGVIPDGVWPMVAIDSLVELNKLFSSLDRENEVLHQVILNPIIKGSYGWLNRFDYHFVESTDVTLLRRYYKAPAIPPDHYLVYNQDLGTAMVEFP